MKSYYTIKVWPKDPHEESFTLNKYNTIEEARADIPNLRNILDGCKWMITVRYGNATSLADNYRNMLKAMRQA